MVFALDQKFLRPVGSFARPGFSILLEKPGCLFLEGPGRREAVVFLRFAAGSAGDQGSLLPIFCLIDLASRVTRVKNV
jgi:hypothetical protein